MKYLWNQTGYRSEKETLLPEKQPLAFQTPVAAKVVWDTWKEVEKGSEP